jgi:hypothetical protein
MMRQVLFALSLFTVVSAFAPTQHSIVTPRSITTTEPISHRNRRAIIVQDGKANGRFFTQQRTWKRQRETTMQCRPSITIHNLCDDFVFAVVKYM